MSKLLEFVSWALELTCVSRPGYCMLLYYYYSILGVTGQKFKEPSIIENRFQDETY